MSRWSDLNFDIISNKERVGGVRNEKALKYPLICSKPVTLARSQGVKRLAGPVAEAKSYYERSL